MYQVSSSRNIFTNIDQHLKGHHRPTKSPGNPQQILMSPTSLYQYGVHCNIITYTANIAIFALTHALTQACNAYTHCLPMQALSSKSGQEARLLY